jgi:hypothetical protein
MDDLEAAAGSRAQERNRTMKRAAFDSSGDRSRFHRGSDDLLSDTWCSQSPHRLEHAVQRRLLAHPELRFSSLVIRRIPNGVCLEGVVESSSDLDVCNLAKTVAGVDEVLNHLVVRRPASSC